MPLFVALNLVRASSSRVIMKKDPVLADGC